MTAKRDLKRRVRERQERTGESYVTARRHVVGEAPDREPAAAPASTMQVVELMNLSDDAARLGLRCRVVMSPEVAERAEPATVLARLRDVLVATAGDPSTALIRDVALSGRRVQHPRRLRNFETLQQFFRRARAGLGGASEDGAMLALPVAGRDGIVPVLCTVWHNEPALILTTFDGEGLDTEGWNQLRIPARGLGAPVASAGPTLFLIFDGRRHPMTNSTFIIGRNKACDLAIRDGNISRKHASVIRRDDVFYIKDLGSANGIFYKGMRIDNKRIDEGDVFHLGEYELRFTYVAND